MKWLLAACLLIAPAFGQSSWTWRDHARHVNEEMRRAHAQALRESRHARLEAQRSAQRFRAEMMREAARARASMRHARDDVRRSIRESQRHDRIWRF